MKRAWKGYALIAPMLAGFLLFYVVPFGQVMWDSLSQGTGKSQLFVGFYNYQRMFQNKMFLTAFGNTLKFLGLGLPLVLLLAYGLALFLKSRARRSPVLRGVFLLPQEEASQPFLEEQELAALFPGGEGEGCRLFSLKDGEAFASQLPLLGAVGVLLLVPLACCVGLCFSIGKRGKGKAKTLWCLLLIASLAGLYFLLRQVNLPASLMPPETIFDLGYYSETLRLLEEGAAAFSEDLLCSETLTLLRQRGRVALLILAGGGMLLLAGMGAAGLAARKGPGKNGR